MTSGSRMLLQYCDVGVTASWEKGPPGARASRPHKSWYSLTHLLDPDRTATAPWLCFGRAQAVPAGSVAGCRIAGKLSGNPRDSMRARRPRSRGVLSRWCAGGYPAGDFSESRRAPFGKLPFVREPCPRRAVRIKRECNNQKSTIPSRPWHPVAVNLNAFVALRRSSVESRGGAPALDRGSPVAGGFRRRDQTRTCGFPASGFQSRSCLRPRMALWLRRQASESIGFP